MSRQLLPVIVTDIREVNIDASPIKKQAANAGAALSSTQWWSAVPNKI